VEELEADTMRTDAQRVRAEEAALQATAALAAARATVDALHGDRERSEVTVIAWGCIFGDADVMWQEIICTLEVPL
jgi:hypothetical protein